MGLSKVPLVGGVKIFCFQLVALMYKNFALGIRLWKTTLCHLLLPCLMIIIFGVVVASTANTGEVRSSSAFAQFSPGQSEGSGGLPLCRVFDNTVGRYGFGAPIPNFPCVTVAYAPNTNLEVNAIMQKVAELNGLSFSTIPADSPLPGVMGFSSAAALMDYEGANPGRLGHGVVFPASFIVSMNETVPSSSVIPTIPIEVIYNKTAVGKFYADTGADPLYSTTGIVSTPLMVQRAVVEAVLALHTGSNQPQVAFDLRKFPTTSDKSSSSSLDNFIGVFVYLGVMIPFVLTIRHVVAEKESNILDAMRMTGLMESAYWLSWFIYFALTSLVSTTLMYIAGYAMGTPIFVFVDGALIFAALYVYFLSTLCLALMLSALVPSTRTAVMIGFCFLAIGVVVQCIFSLASEFLDPLIYNPYVLPTAGRRALNLYPPIVFAKVTSDMSARIQPYTIDGSIETLRHRYTRQDYVDGFYRYGTSKSVVNQDAVNASSCILDAIDSTIFSCNTQSADCPRQGNVIVTSCPTVRCTSSWAASYNGTTACESVGGVFVGGNSCQCRWVNDSDEQLVTTLVGLIFLYLILAWYFGQVFTFGHGRSEPFYFFVLPWYWFPSLKPRKSYGGVFAVATDSDVLSEEEKVRAGNYDQTHPVVARGLSKIFGRFTAVDGLSFAIQRGKCFALLGHNGAGKTTAIKMLNGLIPITDGDVLVEGKSVRHALAEVRQDIGACPQHDILWPELSAYQHLKFFAMFQGLTDREKSIQEMLKAVRLNREGKNPSSSFSGGMKRRLSVAIASLGNKKVVILDEPTTGMDPQNRSHVWRMIADLKKDRAVLLTTHSMEEAEFLGDDIGIMSHGHLIALGTSLKLKAKFGGGYRLNLVVGPNASGEEIRDTVSKLVPGAVLLDQSAGNIMYDLPGSADRQLPELFRWIESQRDALNDWAVSQSSLEDVFIQLTKESMTNETPNNKSGDKKKGGVTADKQPAVAEAIALQTAVAVEATNVEDAVDDSILPEATFDRIGIKRDTERSCLTAYLSQFRGIFLKTWSLFRRNKITMCCQIILPLGLICIIFGIKYAIESSLSGMSSIPAQSVSECQNCMSSVSTSYLNDLAAFTICAQNNPLSIETSCTGYGNGVFAWKVSSAGSVYNESAWQDWIQLFSTLPNYNFPYDATRDLVPTNPVYAYCFMAPPSYFSSTCEDYELARTQQVVREPAAFFSAGSPMGLSTSTPLKIMVVASSGSDVVSKCFNGSNLLVSDLPLNVTSTYTATYTSQSGQSQLNFVSNCNPGYRPSQQFPSLSGAQIIELNSGGDLDDACNVSLADEGSYAQARALSDSAGSGLMQFFPVDVVESLPATTTVVDIFSNYSGLSIPLENVFGIANITAPCSTFFGSVVQNGEAILCDVTCFESFVMNTRSGSSSSSFTDDYGRYISLSFARLDKCSLSRPALMQSPALCSLESFKDVQAKHLQGDLQTRVDSYVFDMQELSKNAIGFASQEFPLTAEGQFNALHTVLDHFPDAALVFHEFDAANARLRFSMQSFFIDNNAYMQTSFKYANVKVKACVGDEALLTTNPNNNNNDVIRDCIEDPDSVTEKKPGLMSFQYGRRWGISIGKSYRDMVGGEETFMFAGIATAALRYATSNGLRVPTSPVGNDVTTQFVLGVRAFPYPASASTSDLDLSLVIGLMVDLLVPFATTMLWPVFVYGFVQEKELKLRAMQTMMGMRQDCYFAVNYVFNFLTAFTMLVLIYILGAAFTIPFFSRNQGALVILIFWIWANTLVALTFFFQTFFSRTRSSNIVIYLVLLASVIGSFMVNFLVFTSTIMPAPSAWLIWPPFVFYRAIHLMNKRSYFLADLTLQDELARLIGILFLETMILFFAAIYLDLVVPREVSPLHVLLIDTMTELTAKPKNKYGRPRHPLFCLLDPFRAFKGRRQSKLIDDESPDDLKVVGRDPDNAVADIETGRIDTSQDAEDPDVIAERQLVESHNYETKPAVEVLHLRKVYGSGKIAVEDVTMHMETGEVFCLLGPNGAGKSTVIGVLTGLFALTKGQASVNGFDVSTQMHRVYEGLGVTPQFDTLWPSLTVMEHLLYYARIKGVPKRDEKAFALRAAQAVRLGNALTKKSRELSGGMRRRLSLAISLVGSPLTIFLDEPTTGLDPETRRQIWQLIESEKRDRCIVLTTHSMEEAEALSNRVAIMAHGLLKTVGTTMQLKAKYGDGYRLQVSFRQGRDEMADSYVRQIVPAATLSESRPGMKTYKISREEGKISQIFEAFLGRDVEASGVDDWGIEQSTLEQVFLKIAAESERVYGTA